MRIDTGLNRIREYCGYWSIAYDNFLQNIDDKMYGFELSMLLDDNGNYHNSIITYPEFSLWVG
jgi:hypothetical protein